MAATLSLTLALGACVQTGASGTGRGGLVASKQALSVTNNGQPLQMWQGREARRLAEATCGARGQKLRVSIYDRFSAGTWVYPEGCA